MNIVPSGGYAFGAFVLNLQRMSLQRDGHDIDLRPKAFDVLRHLIERSGSVVTKEELLAAAWPNVIVADDALTQCIRDIRKALGDDGEAYIRTVQRRGYLFAADVTALDAAGAQQRHSRRPMTAALVASVVALVAIVWFAYLRSAETAPPVVASTNPMVAVLPFEDMTGNPDLAYFGEGVSGDIIAMLARVPDLGVVARNSSFKYRGQAVDIRDVGEELGATHVLEGSVRKDADRVRIVAQLIDARTGKHVWAERFDRTGTDPWALQDEVTEKIVAALAGTAGSIALQQYREAWGKDSANLQEYDYFLRGVALDLQYTPATTDQAIAIVKEGLSKFPRSSLLTAMLAAVYTARHARGWNDNPDPAEDFRRAGMLAREAMGDPSATPLTRMLGHMALVYANLGERRFDQALAEAEAALALSPYDGIMVYHMAEPAILAGQAKRALERIEQAAALYPDNDPRQPLLRSVKAYALFADGKPEEALDALRDIRGMLPGFLLLRARLLVGFGRVEEARADIAKLLEYEPTYTQAKHRRKYFYLDSALIERSIRDLAIAGLPEN